MQNLIDIQPQIVEERYGPEPSLRKMVRNYYGEHFGADKAEELTMQYFKTLFEQVTPFRY